MAYDVLLTAWPSAFSSCSVTWYLDWPASTESPQHAEADAAERVMEMVLEPIAGMAPLRRDGHVDRASPSAASTPGARQSAWPRSCCPARRRHAR